MQIWRSFVRGIFYIHNELVLLFGLLLLGFGGFIACTDALYAFLESELLKDLLVFGLLMMLAAIIGNCMLRYSKKRLLLAYTVIIFVLVAFQLSVAIRVSRFHTSLHHALDRNLHHSQYTTRDRELLQTILHSFDGLYDHCHPILNVIKSDAQHRVAVLCSDERLYWFAVFMEQNCRYTESFCSRLDPVQDAKQFALCVCQNGMLHWLDSQSSLLGTILKCMILVTVIMLLFSIICSYKRRISRAGYEEIPDPIEPRLSWTLSSSSYYSANNDTHNSLLYPTHDSTNIVQAVETEYTPCRSLRQSQYAVPPLLSPAYGAELQHHSPI